MDGRSYSTWNLVNLGFIFFNYLVWNVRKFDRGKKKLLLLLNLIWKESNFDNKFYCTIFNLSIFWCIIANNVTMVYKIIRYYE